MTRPANDTLVSLRSYWHCGRCAIYARPNNAATDEVAMPQSDKPLPDQITAAATELKLARRDGSAEWITKAAKALDELIDQIPRTAQHSDVR